MIALAFLIVISLVAGLACSPQKPSPERLLPPVLSLEVVEVVGPSVPGLSRPLVRPRDVTVNMLNEMYIADYGNDRVVKLDSARTFLREIGGFGTSSYAMNGPIALATDNVSNLYVVDSGNRRILQFDRNLNFINEVTGFTRGEKVDFINPTCIDVSPRGEIFVCDEGLGSCYKFDQFFYYVYEFGSRTSVQPVAYPVDIDYTREEKILVADAHYGYILTFDDFGLYLKSISSEALQRPVSVASAQNRIWVSDGQTGLVLCLDQRGNEVFRWSPAVGESGAEPCGLFIGDDGIIYVVDSATSRIFVTRPIMGR